MLLYVMMVVVVSVFVMIIVINVVDKNYIQAIRPFPPSIPLKRTGSKKETNLLFKSVVNSTLISLMINTFSG